MTAIARGPSASGDQRTARKELGRIERQLSKLDQREAALLDQLATHATDYEKVSTLDTELRGLRGQRSELENTWLELADQVGDA